MNRKECLHYLKILFDNIEIFQQEIRMAVAEAIDDLEQLDEMPSMFKSEWRKFDS
jgi:hypothetical protein